MDEEAGCPRPRARRRAQKRPRRKLPKKQPRKPAKRKRQRSLPALARRLLLVRSPNKQTSSVKVPVGNPEEKKPPKPRKKPRSRQLDPQRNKTLNHKTLPKLSSWQPSRKTSQSVSSFAKNRHLLGFDSPARALLTTVRGSGR